MTIGELKRLLADLPDDMPIRMWAGVFAHECGIGFRVMTPLRAVKDERCNARADHMYCCTLSSEDEP